MNDTTTTESALPFGAIRSIPKPIIPTMQVTMWPLVGAILISNIISAIIGLGIWAILR